ncbi:Growth_factor receptor cysteine-rich domain superfamily [Hexamita inflata]|uniref:Growth factor receptor cysteine-rich domain superfamily n=1 Tax=Hexamita inflata TaxID=28002 RepID=A0AA86UET7_9EUKA|nr:Growth factor receptor cysteine-rich domain superfamily [Hexamita inflata]
MILIVITLQTCTDDNCCYQTYGDGALFKDNQCQCNELRRYIGTLTNSQSKCTRCPEMVDRLQAGCLTCDYVYGEQAIFQNDQCECNTALFYIGTLPVFNSQCTKCPEILDSSQTSCASCYEVYGAGAKFSIDKCICDSQNNYFGTLTQAGDTCLKCPEAIDSSHSCKTCLEVYGTGVVFDSVCKCDTSQKYIGSLLKPTDTCILCSERMNFAKTACILCSQLDSNSQFNSENGQCKCKPGFSLKSKQCTKQSNNITIGLSVGIPISVVVVILIMFLFVSSKRRKDENKLQQTQQQVKNDTNETVQVACAQVMNDVDTEVPKFVEENHVQK